MKFIILSVFIIGLGLLELAAQTKVISIADAKVEGLSISDLDARYQSALHSDTSLAVFKTEEEQAALIKSYQSIVNEIGSYLKDNGVEWGAPTRIFNRFYVGKDGDVEYYVYNFLSHSSQIDDAFTQKFECLMATFFETGKFEITTKTSFAQCSPVVFQ